MGIKTNYKFNFKHYIFLIVFSRIRSIFVINIGKIVNRLLSYEQTYRKNKSQKEYLNTKKTSQEKVKLMARPAGPRVSQHANYKVFIDENLILPNGNLKFKRKEGSIHKIGAYAQNKAACNGWTYWFVKQRNKVISINDHRTLLREESSSKQ